MTKKLNVRAFSSKGRRIIATVLQYAYSPKYEFSLLPEGADASGPESQLHLSIVDSNDPIMMAQWEAACKANQDLKAIYLVTADSQSHLQSNSLMGSQLVSHLVPMLEKQADDMHAVKPVARSH